MSAQLLTIRFATAYYYSLLQSLWRTSNRQILPAAELVYYYPFVRAAQVRLPLLPESDNLVAMSLNRVKTPCIGVCSTTFGDTVCRGCKRYLHEIVDWNRYTEAQKALVWQRLDLLLRTVVSNYVLVDDAQLLEEQLAFQNIRRQPQLSPQGWVPELLKAAGVKPLDWSSYGLTFIASPTDASANMAPRDLYDHISADVHALAVAHYDRNHRLPQNRLADLLAELTVEESPSNT